MNDTDTGPPRAQRFAHIYEQTYAALLRFVERRVHPSHAEDVIADVFLAAWRRLDGPTGRAGARHFPRRVPASAHPGPACPAPPRRRGPHHYNPARGDRHRGPPEHAMNDTLGHALRDLDPAVTPADLDTGADPRARALLGVSGDRAAEAQEKCLDRAQDIAKRTTGRELGFRPVVTEGRGPWTLVYVNDSSHLAEIRCLFRDGDIAAAGGSTPGADAQPLPPVPAGSARAALGSVVSSSEESVRIVTGRVGAGVVGLQLSTEAKGSVNATVTGGYFAAWWPDAPTTEERENASPRGGVKSVTTILQDGSRHSVSPEELTGRTSAQLSTPATGGSVKLD
ncbi:RNA polymerase sigma factor [Microbispora sp. CA-135349]|uniref:RNA polymerase sigma factor n=1 Tax=Microbispora sp. CA-135349 TaxID=3239953 RepID=UPI003D90E904